jgi:hypothetical protein
VVHDYGVSVGQELLYRQLTASGGGFSPLSMCFLNGGLFPETHRARFIQRLLNSPIGGLVARLGNERTFRRSFSAVFCAQTQPSDAELSAFWSLVSGAHMLQRYAEVVGPVDVLRLPGIGHYPQCEAPDPVAQGILSFIARLA